MKTSGYWNILITSENRIFFWGSGYANPTGINQEILSPTEVSNYFDMGKNETIESVFLGAGGVITTNTGKVFAWGYNYYNNLFISFTILTPIKVSILVHNNIEFLVDDNSEISLEPYKIDNFEIFDIFKDKSYNEIIDLKIMPPYDLEIYIKYTQTAN